MNRSSRDRSSRLSEFRDCDAEWRETGNREAAVRRHEAMRSKDVRECDFLHASEELKGRVEDVDAHGRDACRRVGLDLDKLKKERRNG